MVREVLVQMTSPSGYPIRVVGFRFGEGRPKVAVVGGLRGDELQQGYAVAGLGAFLRREIEKNPRVIEGEVLVIPWVNTFGMNVGSRVWPSDFTDIDRMFPGYRFGETTQILAHFLFEKLKDVDYGVHVTSLDPLKEDVIHAFFYKSGMERLEDGSHFGARFLHVRPPNPFETGSLLYNWQVWDVQAFGLIGGRTMEVQEGLALEQTMALVRFLSRLGVLKLNVPEHFVSVLLEEKDILSVRNQQAGLFFPHKTPGTDVTEGETVGVVRDTLTGEVIEKLISPALGTLFSRYARPVLFAEDIAFRIATR